MTCSNVGWLDSIVPCGAACCTGTRSRLGDVVASDDFVSTPANHPGQAAEGEPRPERAGYRWVDTGLAGYARYVQVPDGPNATDAERSKGFFGQVARGADFFFSSLYDGFKSGAIADKAGEIGTGAGRALAAGPAGAIAGAIGGGAGQAIRSGGSSFLDSLTGAGGPPSKPGELPRWVVPAAVGGALLLLFLSRK